MLLKYKTIRLNGNLVIFNYDCRQQLHEIMNEPFIEIDMTDTDIVDSTGLELITKLRHNINEKRGHLRIINVNPSVSNVFDVCGLTNFIEVNVCEKI